MSPTRRRTRPSTTPAGPSARPPASAAGPRALLLPLLVPLLAAAAGCGEESDAERAERLAPDSVDFAAHVAPILHENCVACHRPGGSAPFSLLEYEDASERGPLIAAVTRRHFMPPWLPAPEKTDFAGERVLSEVEIATLGRWVEQGMPPGDPADLPPPPRVDQDWDLGPPDQIVTLPEPYVVPAEGRDIYRNLVLPVPGEGTRWVRAVEIRPGNPRVVHHATLMVDATGHSREMDAADPEPGFDGMMHHGGVAPPEGFFVGWTPGKVPDPGEEAMAWRLEEGTDLILQLHVRPTGEPEELRPRIGLHFSPDAPEHSPYVLTLGSRMLDIPAGEPEYVVEDEYRLPVDVRALRIYPHAHYLGKEMRVWAELPDGSERWLLHIPRWDFDWQDEYRYEEPVPLPRGTRIRMRFTFDNSAENPHNPHDPPRRVTYGPEATDEMADVTIQVLPHTREERVTLQRDFERKLEMELTGLAIRDYRAALRISPDDPRVHYRLGAALAEAGEREEAASHLRRAVELDPEFAPAHESLATILREGGRTAEAIVHYRQALASEPDLPDAHFGLGIALAATGMPEEAAERYRDASRLRPDWPLPLIGLGWLLATHPDPGVRDPEEAVAVARRAVDLTEEANPLALDVLGAAYAAAGRFEEARETAERAVAVAAAGGANELVMAIRQRLRLYEQDRAFMMPSGPAGQ